jgi:DNA-binding beta-propeller fold protein YncE
MAQYGTPFMIGFVFGVAFLFVFGVVTERDIRYMGFRGEDVVVFNDVDLSDEKVQDINTATALVTVTDQMPGGAVSVERVEINEDGWVVVHETEAGHVLNALGAARLDAGTHESVRVDLLRETNPGGTYAIILYTDNGNKEFEIRGDLPMIDAEGNPVMQSFRTYGGAAGR